MKTVQASANLEILDDISRFLRAFWDHQKFRLGRPHAAYRAPDPGKKFFRFAGPE